MTGGKLPPFSTVEPWRLASVSFDGQRILVGGMSTRLHLLDSAGKTVQTFTLESPPVALAMDALGRMATSPCLAIGCWGSTLTPRHVADSENSLRLRIT